MDEPSPMYVCTFVEKEVEPDSFEHGCSGKRTCIISDDVNFRAVSIGDLLKKIGDHYGLEIDDVWTGGLENGFLSWNRLENSDGDEPDEHEIETWKKGKLKLWLADWSFMVEKIVVHSITAEDLVGVKTHE